MTQGVISLPTLFNVAVDSMVRHFMSLTVEDKSATQEGIGMAIGWCMVACCADDGMIGSRDP